MGWYGVAGNVSLEALCDKTIPSVPEEAAVCRALQEAGAAKPPTLLQQSMETRRNSPFFYRPFQHLLSTQVNIATAGKRKIFKGTISISQSRQ